MIASAYVNGGTERIGREYFAHAEGNSPSDEENRQAEKETDRQLKELGKQIGGLGNKFGSFAEGLAYRSIVKILQEKFGRNDFIAPGAQVRKDGREEEYDVLAYSNGGSNQGMIVEIKSNPRKEDIAQMKRKMDGVFQLLPEHRNKTFQGMIACVSGTADLKQQVLENGWYLAHIGEDLFGGGGVRSGFLSC